MPRLTHRIDPNFDPARYPFIPADVRAISTNQTVYNTADFHVAIEGLRFYRQPSAPCFVIRGVNPHNPTSGNANTLLAGYQIFRRNDINYLYLRTARRLVDPRAPRTPFIATNTSCLRHFNCANTGCAYRANPYLNIEDIPISHAQSAVIWPTLVRRTSVPVAMLHRAAQIITLRWSLLLATAENREVPPFNPPVITTR
jgi:hypothetical protein